MLPMLAQLAQEPVELEAVLVTPSRLAFEPPPPADFSLRLVAADDSSRGGLLNAGAAAARGEVLLFLWPGSQLPFEALLTIEKNLSLLPQTVGGNFHLTFDASTFLSRRAAGFIATQRYGGNYYGNSAIFVRRTVFEALGGFAPLTLLEDFEFGRRLEAAGPTLYLPDKIIAPTAKFGVKGALVWGIVLLLQKLGLSPPVLASVAKTLGWK
ncbi:MAG: hypothetical protein Kow0031_12930 [Anaerolineae bacterium]